MQIRKNQKRKKHFLNILLLKHKNKSGINFGKVFSCLFLLSDM